MAARRKKKGATLATVRKCAMALPGVVEATSYGTPAFKVRGKLLARMHQEEPAVVIRFDRDDRALLIDSDPETFYITDHYLNYSWVLVRLANATEDILGGLLEQAWRQYASKKQLAEYDE